MEVGMDPARIVGAHLAPSLDCWCFRDPICGCSQWGMVRSVGTDRVSGGIVWGRSTDDGTLPGPIIFKSWPFSSAQRTGGMLAWSP